MHIFILGLLAGGAMAGVIAASIATGLAGQGVAPEGVNGAAIGLGAAFGAALTVLGIYSLEALHRRRNAEGPALALHRFGVDAKAALDVMLGLMRDQPALLTGETDAQVRQYMHRRCEKLAKTADRNIQVFCPMVPGAGAPVGSLAASFDALQLQWRWADHDTVERSCLDALSAADQLHNVTRRYL